MEKPCPFYKIVFPGEGADRAPRSTELTLPTAAGKAQGLCVPLCPNDEPTVPALGILSVKSRREINPVSSYWRQDGEGSCLTSVSACILPDEVSSTQLRWSFRPASTRSGTITSRQTQSSFLPVHLICFRPSLYYPDLSIPGLQEAQFLQSSLWHGPQRGQ